MRLRETSEGAIRVVGHERRAPLPEPHLGEGGDVVDVDVTQDVAGGLARVEAGLGVGDVLRVSGDAEDALAVEAAWAAKGCFNVTSTRVFSDQFCQKKHLPDENLRRDDHSSKNELKRVETGRDMSLES